MKDLEPFYPDRMASRILGMGNVVSLVEKPATEVSDVEASAMTKSMSNATFDLDDFLINQCLLLRWKVAKIILCIESGIRFVGNCNSAEVIFTQSLILSDSRYRYSREKPNKFVNTFNIIFPLW